MNTPQILRALAEAEEYAYDKIESDILEAGGIEKFTDTAQAIISLQTNAIIYRAEKLREIAGRIERNEVDITKQPTIIAMATEMFDTDQPSVVNPLSHEQSK